MCVVRESIDVDIEFLIGNLQQWKFRGYNLNLIKISVMKMQLNWYGNENTNIHIMLNQVKHHLM